MLVNALQKYEPKNFTGLVTSNHLGAIFATEPILASKLIENIYQVNVGQDIVSYMDRFPTHYLEDDRPYEWLLQGADEKNTPLLAFGDSTLSAITYPGIGRSNFFMKFGEKLFKTTDVIVGHKPDLYRLRIVGEQSDGGGNWVFEVNLVTGDDTLFIPTDELAVGTRWSKEYSLVPQTLSKEGGETFHTSPFRMSNVLSMIRKQYTVPGDMIVKGQNAPLAFAFRDQAGNTQTQWIKKLDYDFMTQFRREKARLLAYGTSNRRADGSYGNTDVNGFEIRSGAGLYEQISPSNIFFYNTFDIDWLTDIALGLSVGKLPEDSREFVLSTGEYGMVQFHKAVQEKSALYTPNFSSDRIQFNGGKMSYSGQFLEYAAVNGIKFRLMHDPMKDDPIRNKIQHPNGGLASSYEYTIMDFGTANGEPNVRKVSVKGNEEMFRYIPGLRDPFSPINAQTQPGMAASSVDGYEVHRAYIGGVMVKNPMRMARVLPSLLA